MLLTTSDAFIECELLFGLALSFWLLTAAHAYHQLVASAADSQSLTHCIGVYENARQRPVDSFEDTVLENCDNRRTTVVRSCAPSNSFVVCRFRFDGRLSIRLNRSISKANQLWIPRPAVQSAIGTRKERTRR